MFIEMALATVLLVPPAEAEPNPRCPVTGLDVQNHLIYKWVEVRGRRYFVHDRRAAHLLKVAPDLYRLADGTPRNHACGCLRQR